MSGDNQLTGALLGVSTTAASVAVLPNTQGNTLLTVLSIILAAAGLLVIASFIAVKVIAHRRQAN